MSSLRRYPITTFIVLAYGLAWIAWVPSVIAYRRYNTPFPLSHLIAGAYAPTVAALLVSAIQTGRAGIAQLLRRRAFTLGSWRWYLVGALLACAPAALVAAIARLAGAQLGAFTPQEIWSLPAVLARALPVGPLGEELGWRGFLLPSLRQRTNLFAGAGLVGVVWAGWHAPLFWAPYGSLVSGAPVTRSSVAIFFTVVVGLSYVFAWVWAQAGETVGPTVLMHVLVNANIVALLFKGIAPVQQRMVGLSVVVLWSFAIVLVIAWRPMWFTRETLR